MQPVGIGKVQNDMQARIQSFLEAFRLFLVFSVQTKPKNTVTFDCKFLWTKKNISTLKYAFLIQIGLIIFLFLLFNLFISSWSLWSNSTHPDESSRVESSKASRCAIKYSNWIRSQAGINSKAGYFCKAWDTLDDWTKS